MKSITHTIILATAVLSFGFFQSDDCSVYAPTKEGTEIELKSYTDNDKLSGTNRSKVVAVRKTPSGAQEIEMQSETFDKKDKPLGTASYVVSCENGNFMVDMRTMISSDQMANFKDMQMAIEADKLDIPANPTVGQELKGGTVKITSSSEGSPISMKLSMTVSNRKVAAIEELTVPAGTFKCVKITYDAESKMLFTIKTKGVEWYAKEVGLVRSESYNSKNKLMGYTVLTSKK